MVKTKEEIALQNKQYYLENKEKLLLQKKQYNLENKEKIAIYKKQYRLENREKLVLYNKKYNLENHRQITIQKWKYQGLICGDFDELYDYFKSVNNCERCDVLLTSGENCNTRKVMDHDHSTGEFRNVLCNLCNWHLKE